VDTDQGLFRVHKEDADYNRDDPRTYQVERFDEPSMEWFLVDENDLYSLEDYELLKECK